jgi:TPR repeat protein
MWGNKAAKLSRMAWAGPLVAAAGSTTAFRNSAAAAACDDNKHGNKQHAFSRLRKRTTLAEAGGEGQNKLRRTNTKAELSKIRAGEKEMLKRWEKDEDGWRELPARAWPSYQPDENQLKGIKIEVAKHNCADKSTVPNNNDFCKELLFNMATALVFYNLDTQTGFQQYEELAKQGHVDSMVACGVVLVEGLGIAPREEEGVEWLKKAVERGSTQAYYELGTVFYTGIDGVEEDMEAAFRLFEKAAEHGHTAGMYMTADCLIEGEGTAKDMARAIPLLYRAAEKGHRYSRQRVRELLSSKVYQPW